MPPPHVVRTRGCLMCVYDLRSLPRRVVFFPTLSISSPLWPGRAGWAGVRGTALNCKFGRLIYLITGLTFRQFLIVPRILAAGNEM